MTNQPIALFFKAHIKGYTRKDGTFVGPHEDSRQASLFDEPAMPVLFFHPHADTSSNLINNEPVPITEPKMINTDITMAALGNKADRLTAALAELDATGPIIKARYADLRSRLASLFEQAATEEVSNPYLSLDREARPDWFDQEVYYNCKQLQSLKKCKAACVKRAADSTLAQRAVAFFSEWEPIVAKLEARKADITTASAQREEKKEVARREAAAIPVTEFATAVRDAVHAHKPALVNDYVQYVGRVYARMVNDYGPEIRDIKDKGDRSVFSETLKPLMDANRQLVPALVQAAATSYADGVAESLQFKIMGKAGDLKEPNVSRLTGSNFRIHGKLGSKAVTIEQNTIINVSPLGKLFNQFPARIYVEGKFMSEAAYKTMQLNDVNVFDEDLLSAARADSRATSGMLRHALDEDVQGVLPGKVREFDRLMARGDFSEAEVKAAFKATLDLMRRKHGDAVTMWRADAPASLHNAGTRTVLMAGKDVAMHFAKNGREAKKYTVKTDDVLAVFALPSGYYEAIVKRPA